VKPEAIRDGLEQIGLTSGPVLYAHVSMRSLGYVPGGAEAVLQVILDLLGRRGTLVMSSSPEPDPSRINSSRTFDLNTTPSGSGSVSEALRRHAGARRSLHPIAPLSAVGPAAAEIVEGHESSPTPFSADGPYGRLARLKPTLLLIGTHAGSLLYHVMDRVGFPNLYVEPTATFEARDAAGKTRRIATPRLNSAVPPVVILPGNRPENRDYLLMADYALMFPVHREREVIEAGYLRYNKSRFLGRRDRWRARGLLTIGRVGRADAALLDGARMLDQVAEDLRWDIERFKEEYDPDFLSRLTLPAI
jgi:aminoglycoside 3-N-acetyltransferase